MSRAKKVDVAAATSAVALKQMVQVGKAIGHPARLRILAMLSGRTLCVCQMTSVLELASSTVSGHLTELRRSGLVSEDKQGKLVFYRLDERSPFADLVADILTLADLDETVAQDRSLIDRVRAVPIEVLTRAGLRLDRVGIKRPALRGAPGARA
jgi:ArsR family transcriptional regulator, arsenate/arsenite/antimonite-responsive transcriptional repressor